jgi:hypothetical protein
VTEPEAAHFLGINTRTLYRYRKAGKIRATSVISPKKRACLEYFLEDLQRLKAELDAKQAKAHTAPKIKRATITFGLPPAEYEEIVREANTLGVPISVLARRLVRESLESQIRMKMEQTDKDIVKMSKDMTRLLEDFRKMRREFSEGLEIVLEFSGMAPDEAKAWANKNLRG